MSLQSAFAPRHQIRPIAGILREFVEPPGVGDLAVGVRDCRPGRLRAGFEQRKRAPRRVVLPLDVDPYRQRDPVELGVDARLLAEFALGERPEPPPGDPTPVGPFEEVLVGLGQSVVDALGALVGPVARYQRSSTVVIGRAVGTRRLEPGGRTE
ncbi:hypothetical protein [Halorussus marinus]|uniref:hypothetical protein n=1 Tax=Halorussus marinus TaxID=2505976 RepID=UPI001ADA5762